MPAPPAPRSTLTSSLHYWNSQRSWMSAPRNIQAGLLLFAHYYRTDNTYRKFDACSTGYFYRGQFLQDKFAPNTENSPSGITASCQPRRESHEFLRVRTWNRSALPA
jgi:hypothetical protein